MLAFALIVTLVASAGTVGAESGSQKAPDLSEFRFEGLESPPLNVKHFGADAVSHHDRTTLQHVDDEERHPQIVIGPDSRIQVSDTTIYPYSAVAQIIGYDASLEPGFASGCTATFVGPDVLLTAAHCVWSVERFGGWIDEVEIIPGMNGDSAPFGVLVPETIWFPDEYVENDAVNSPWDYALITVSDTSVEEVVGSLTIGVLTTSELQSASFNPTTSGYPGDKTRFTQWIGSEPAFVDVDDDWLVHEIDSFQGQSGSAVWRASDLAVVGVESWENQNYNFTVRIDLPLIYDLLGACLEFDCQLNHFLTDIPGDEGAYDRVWQRTDQPVAQQVEPRTWMWGPQPITKVMLEPYAEAPNGFRAVLYQEKSRMEITDPSSDANSNWYVTNGLATVEMMTGELQLGNDLFEQHNPAEINVAGDGDDPNGPTYVTFAGLRSLPPHGGAPALSSELEGGPALITSTVDRAGNVGNDQSLATYGVTADHYVPETQHRVASVFWQFMNSSGTVWQNGQYVQDQLFTNPFFATGYPITEAYWATVKVGGTERVVLAQAFERRVLTYTPGNPEGFLVEAGNVGVHYHQWRYELIPSEDSGNGGGPADPPPAIGELLGRADFSMWPELETTNGDVGGPVDGVYQVTDPPGGFLQVLAEGTFGDAYYSLEARATQTSGAGAACLLFRADPNEANPLYNDFGYWFCLVYEGPSVVGVAVVYETVAGTTEIAGAEALEPYPLASDWHQIGVVAKGQKFWLEVNGEIAGSITHDIGPGSGQVGMLTLNLDATEGASSSTFQFRNLEIYALAS